jgi:hypothetical protein
MKTGAISELAVQLSLVQPCRPAQASMEINGPIQNPNCKFP